MNVLHTHLRVCFISGVSIMCRQLPKVQFYLEVLCAQVSKKYIQCASARVCLSRGLQLFQKNKKTTCTVDENKIIHNPAIFHCCQTNCSRTPTSPVDQSHLVLDCCRGWVAQSSLRPKVVETMVSRVYFHWLWHEQKENFHCHCRTNHAYRCLLRRHWPRTWCFLPTKKMDGDHRGDDVVNAVVHQFHCAAAVVVAVPHHPRFPLDCAWHLTPTLDFFVYDPNIHWNCWRRLLLAESKILPILPWIDWTNHNNKNHIFDTEWPWTRARPETPSIWWPWAIFHTKKPRKNWTAWWCPDWCTANPWRRIETPKWVWPQRLKRPLLSSPPSRSTCWRDASDFATVHADECGTPDTRNRPIKTSWCHRCHPRRLQNTDRNWRWVFDCFWRFFEWSTKW